MRDVTHHRPASEQELCEIVRVVAEDGGKLSIEGGGSKSAIGQSTSACPVLSMRSFSGIADYDPPELVLTAGAATPMADIEKKLAENGQMLAFEPFDPTPILGGESGRATIGGVIAAGLSGSQRLTHGAVRDHLLGFSAVSGRGELFVAGGKVVKNVTGYDLSKLMCGSWGRLAALTQVTVKVLPRPAMSATMVAYDLDVHDAWKNFASMLGSQAEIAAAAHAPAGVLGKRAVSAVRLQGFAPSVDARCAIVEALACGTGFRRVDRGQGDAIWSAFRDLSALPSEPPLWRVLLPAREVPGFLHALPDGNDQWMMDWAGGLVWLSSDSPAEVIRSLALRSCGHAMMMRAKPEIRNAVEALHPQQPAICALEERVRRAFDPKMVFETGRF